MTLKRKHYFREFPQGRLRPGGRMACMTESGSAGPVPVAVAVVFHGGRVLAALREDGTPPWVFPGGKIQPGESPADCAERECYEETGVVVSAREWLGGGLHPATEVLVAYIACVPIMANLKWPAGALPAIAWLTPAAALDLMPGMFPPVREHLGLPAGP